MKALVAFALVIAGCAPSRAPSVERPPEAQWLCRPDRTPNPCTTDLDATELGGAQRVDAFRAQAAPKADCFYVYPTVDLELVPGIHEDLRDSRRELATTRAPAARFGEACALWVPLYRQVTLGTWLQPKPERERLLALAYADVERAFAEYLAASGRRPIVLVGHSQGAEMVVRLLRRFFDGDATMRSRLVLAMPIGGEVETAAGSTTGGTFQSIPVCTRPLETGCIVAYRSHYAGTPVDATRWAPAPGHETACVDPSALDREGGLGVQPLSRSYFPAHGELARFLRGTAHVRTPFVVLRDFYEASCVRGEGGYAYLAVDARAEGPIDLGSPRLRIGKLGLHVLDLQLAQGDLVDLVARRVARLP